MIKDAKFSDCGKYRFCLSRLWDTCEHDVSTLMLIGLNPSTADSKKDDPTIESIIRIAKYNGYGGIVMTNLFPFITPYPKELKADDSYLMFNDEVLKANANSSTDVCFCWGTFKQALARSTDIIKMFPDALCLGKNKNGSPRHPLFMEGTTELIKF